MNTVSINGKTYHLPNGNVSICNNKIYVNGKLQDIEEFDGKSIDVTIHGNVDSIKNVDGSIKIDGSVDGNIKSSGSINVGQEVQGNIQASGSVNVMGPIYGKVTASGSISSR